MTRRSFLLSAALARAAMAKPQTILDPNGLARFVDPLFIPPRAVASGELYRLTMRELETRFHRDLPVARVWGFNTSSPGPTIEARSGQAIQVEWINALPEKHLFTIDHSLHGAERSVPDVRSVVHLHGARAPAPSDGYPENWYTAGKSQVCTYPNLQEATALWYHDHAMSITRLNLYAGLLGYFLIRDEVEDAIQFPSGEYEIPLFLFDRSLTTDGQLFYPVSPNPDRPWIAEFAGEAILANGKLYPYLEVEPRAYRLRVANVCNSRFLSLELSDGRRFRQIGSDQGLLETPVTLSLVTLAPAERADLIVDFSGSAGQSILLASDTYPILQFRVSGRGNSAAYVPPARLRPVQKIRENEAVKTRLLTLNGADDADDSVNVPMVMTLNGAGWHDPVTERPVLNTVEIWSLINLTDDSHPIHLHLVRFQILDRRPFDLFAYVNEGQLRFTAEAIPPEPIEAGWKDTVRADPGMVTRIIIRFEGYAGRYVWHCHILEHEDNDMMRPYDILPAEPS